MTPVRTRTWTGATALVAALVLGASSGGAAAADEAPATPALSTEVAAPTPPPPSLSRWHGSTLLLDQSTTTQTLHIGGDYQSSNPTYELWLAFKPRYFLYESKTNALSANLWANLYFELTDSDTTTRQREPLLGPTYVWLSYAHTFIEGADAKTVLALGPRVVAPTDKAARGSGQIVGAGGSASLSQYFPLRGSNAPSLQTARLGGGVIYNHPFWRATSPVNGDIQQLRQDVAGRTVVSDLLTGGMNVRDTLSASASGDLRILPKLELSLSYVWLNSWTYTVPTNVTIDTPTGPVTPMGITDPTHYRVSTWATASLTYEPSDEYNISIGYYNLASQIGPSGTRRSPLWSPAARFFLTVTGNLDVLVRRNTRR